MRSVRDKSARPIGRVVPAPEHHLSAETIKAAKGRRGFLASAAAQFVTGVVLPVDGGYLIS